MNVAVVGASDKPERYSHQALVLLKETGHTPFPVHPSLEAAAGLKAYKAVRDIPEPVDTVTVYLSARNQGSLAEDVLASGARRVILNPGAESPALAERLRAAGVNVLEACTLVLLRTGQF